MPLLAVLAHWYSGWAPDAVTETPPERTFVIPAEDRTLSVAHETRTLVVT